MYKCKKRLQMYNCCGKAFNMIYFTQLYNPSNHMFNVWRLRIALQWVWCCLLLDQAYQPPQPDRQHRNLVMINVTINIILIVMTSPWRPWRRSQGRPRPGWRSRAPATRPPSAGSRTGTCCLNTQSKNIYSPLKNICYSIVCHLTRGVYSWRALTSSHWCSPGWISVQIIRYPQSKIFAK